MLATPEGLAGGVATSDASSTSEGFWFLLVKRTPPVSATEPLVGRARSSTMLAEKTSLGTRLASSYCA